MYVCSEAPFGVLGACVCVCFDVVRERERALGESDGKVCPRCENT